MRYFLLSLTLIFTSLYATPYNSNILIQRGIDPQILNLSVTTFRQNIAYKVQAKYTEQVGTDVIEQEFNILYNPYAEYGIDIQIEIPKKDMNHIDAREVRDQLDATMGLQSYLQTRALYVGITLFECWSNCCWCG